jgi:hypothetical protein
MGIIGAKQSIIQQALHLVNLVRLEVGEPTLPELPRGSLRNPEQSCPIARALVAVVRLEEAQIVFCYEWHSAAAAKRWKMPFSDGLLMSVEMPEVMLEFVRAFRAGAFPDLLEDT